MNLFRWEKKNFFNNIRTRDIADNKTFWKTVKPLFTDKAQTKSKITLTYWKTKVVSGEEQEQIVSEKVISQDQGAVEIFIKFFIDIVPDLKIPTNHNNDTDFLVSNDQVASALNKFRSHSSIVMNNRKTKNNRKTDQCFSFGPVTYHDILKK